MEDCVLIVGLGNPGRTYDNTRHNIGFRVMKALADKYGIIFRPSLANAKGSVGKGEIKEVKVHLLMPLTYMNESGQSVSKWMKYAKIPMERVLIITDDIALPFGHLRIKEKGSSGGHNGLKSVESYLGSPNYPRLRMGVGDSRQDELADYVLGRFTEEEQRELPDVVDRAIEAIELWVTDGIATAMQKANRSK